MVAMSDDFTHLGLNSRMQAIGGIPDRQMQKQAQLKGVSPYDFNSTNQEIKQKIITTGEIAISRYIQDSDMAEADTGMVTGDSLAVVTTLTPNDPTTYNLGVPSINVVQRVGTTAYDIYPRTSGLIDPFAYSFWSGFENYPLNPWSAYVLIINNVSAGTVDLHIDVTWRFIQEKLKTSSQVYGD